MQFTVYADITTKRDIKGRHLKMQNQNQINQII